MTLFKYHAKAARSRSAATLIGLFLLTVLVTLSFTGSALSAQATVDLGDADSFGALSFTAMTNAGGTTVVNGDIGSSTSIHAGVTHPGYAAYGAGSSQLAAAQASLLTAYNFTEAQTPDQPTITGVNLAGKTLGPGVYNSTSAILISGPIPLTLDGGGDSNSVFIFQAASSGDLTVDPTSSVTYTNGAQPCNVFWKVNSAFLKNAGFTFVGTILALTQITLTDNITVEGRVLARNADVTFIHDTINKPTCATPPPTTTATTTTAATTTTPVTTTTATTTTATTTTGTTTTPATTTTATTTTTPATTITTPGTTVTTPGTTITTPATTTTTSAVPPKATPKPKPAPKPPIKTHRTTTTTHGFAKPPKHHVGLTG
jgi:hypothetical protein